MTTSRMVPYKKIELIVEAFNGLPDKHLVVIGDGPDYQKISDKAGANVELLGYQNFDVLLDYLQRAKAFVFAAEEDFGIAPIEAQACGTPVIAYGKGGALETILGSEHSHPTGVFFTKQTVESLISAVEQFENNLENFTPNNCRSNALRFSSERFRNELSDYIENISR